MEDHYLRKTAAQVDDLLDKIDGVEAHAQVNVQSDWNQNDSTADDFVKNKPTVDSAPTESSTNLVQSGGVYEALSGKVDSTSLATVATSGLYSDLTGTPTIPDELSDLSDDATHRLVTDTEKTTWNAKSDFSGSYNDLTDKPTIPTVNDKTITIQKNGVAVESFTLNQASDETINITVPVTAADVSALPSSTKYGSSFVLSIDSSTYVVTATLKDQDGNTLGSAQTIDLPLETMVVSGSYDSQTKKVILTLKNGQTVEFSIADLVSGLQTEITSNNKLSSDLVDDTGATNKFFSGNYADLSNKPTLGTAASKDMDNALSDVSENPVQNKVVKGGLDLKAAYTDFPTESEIDEMFSEWDNVEHYGLRIDKNNDDPRGRCTYLYDCANFTPKQCQSDGTVTSGSWDNAFFVKNNYPAMYTFAGVEDYKLSKSNHAYKEDGTTASDVASTSYAGNALSVFDCHIWMKFWEDDNYLYIEVSNQKLDDDFVDWPYILDDGSKSSKLFYPMFEGTIVDGKLRSIGTGKATGNTDASEELAAAQANDGLGSNSVWSIGDWSHYMWLLYLSMLVGKTTCPEMALGEGNTNGGSDASGFCTNGTLIDKGAFWGKPRSSTDSENNQPVKLFFIENPYANRWKRTLGMYNANGVYYVKTSPPYTIDESYDNYTNCGALPTSSNWLQSVKLTTGGFLPSTVSSTDLYAKYYGAKFYTTNSATQRKMLLTGGRCTLGANCGFWYLDLSCQPSIRLWHIGASLYLKTPSH